MFEKSIFPINLKECSGCGACIAKCPQHAITLDHTSEGFRIPKLDPSKCTNCGICKKKCPLKNPVKENTIKGVFGVINKNREVLLRSSSGGAFFPIAECIIKRNGVVFGVQYDENFNVFHSYSETIEGLEKYQQSKYVESDLRNVFQETKAFLEAGRDVLFTGTPCQIQGLKNFLGKDYEKLFTMDLICHGVPSQTLLQKYIKSEKVTYLNMRSKCEKWSEPMVEWRTRKKTTFERNNVNIYLRLFYLWESLRVACLKCPFCSLNRVSDITIGDYWGVENYYPDLETTKGVSVILLNTEKGVAVWNENKSNFDHFETHIDYVIKRNPQLVPHETIAADVPFYKDLEKLSFKKFCNKYIPPLIPPKPTFLEKWHGKICRRINKIKKFFTGR